MKFLRLIKLIFCLHDWREEIGRIAPVGAQGQRCGKCEARRTIYAR